MTPHITHTDVLDERESLRGPFLKSVLLHVSLAGLFVVSSLTFQRSHENWGSANTSSGDAVTVNAVKNIPLPSRSGPINPVANDTEFQVPQPPKAQPRRQVKEEPEKAIPLKSRLAKRQPRPEAPERYHPQPLKENQLFHSEGQAAVSPMFQKPGTGAVGVGPNSVFGTRFGGYATLVIQRVTEKWQTGGLAGPSAPLVVITFDILRDGSIRNAQIAQRSGNSTLDFSALRAVMDAAPFPPLPATYDRNQATVELRFQLQR
ncbi:MAG TPA: cell envelope integrity protein TolA [Bryobacteraceae bacterium]|nr:cell envelope integrity protein TolA [Bryobacteraceae bacterium]